MSPTLLTPKLMERVGRVKTALLWVSPTQSLFKNPRNLYLKIVIKKSFNDKIY